MVQPAYKVLGFLTLDENMATAAMHHFRSRSEYLVNKDGPAHVDAEWVASYD